MTRRHDSRSPFVFVKGTPSTSDFLGVPRPDPATEDEDEEPAAEPFLGLAVSDLARAHDFGLLRHPNRIYCSDHGPARFHAENQGERASFDFAGNVIDGQTRSRTALRLVKEWADLHRPELEEDGQRAREGVPLNYIEALH